MNDKQLNAVISALGGGFVVYLSLLIGQWLSGVDMQVSLVFTRTIAGLLVYTFLRYLSNREG